MDRVALLNLSSSDLLAINRCRMVQKVLFISDILDGWGTSLHQPVLHPPRHTISSCWNWPRAFAVAADWVIWE